VDHKKRAFVPHNRNAYGVFLRKCIIGDKMLSDCYTSRVRCDDVAAAKSLKSKENHNSMRIFDD
jgi:hypothetical protein